MFKKFERKLVYVLNLVYLGKLLWLDLWQSEWQNSVD